MKIGALQLAILVLISLNAKPLLACQPLIISERNFVFELEDGEHVFAIKYHDDVAFEYPVSGVYRKGPPRELVWQYRDNFSIWDLADRISSTGQYFVEPDFRILEEDELDDPGNDQRVVLSIYDRGKLIGEFTRETFIHGELLRQDIRQYLAAVSSGKRMPVRCSPRVWGHMEYDKLIDQVRVRSSANRTVVIDVPTAEILYVDDY